MKYENGKGSVLIDYCDSDWNGSENDMRSISGYASTFGSGMFSWASVKQNCVDLSTKEAEYISAAEANIISYMAEICFRGFGELQAKATPLICDDTSTISITKNPVFYQKIKHIDRRYHFIKDALQQGTIDLIYVQQINKLLTSSLRRQIQLFERIARCESSA